MNALRLTSLAVLVCGLLALSGCDDKNNQQTVQPTASAAAEQNSKAETKPDAAQLEKLAQQSAGKPLKLLDASEVQLDGASTLVLTFSIPLDPNQDFNKVAHLVDKTSGKVDGAWELSSDLKELRLRHLEPKRTLIVTVDSGLLALNKATLEDGFEKQIATRDIQPSVGFASRGSLLPTKVIAGLPVMALNVDNVDVNFYRIKDSSLSAFVSQWQYRNSVSNWESDNLLKLADLVYTGRFDLNPARNTREKLMLPLGDIKPLQQPGVYLAIMSQAGHYAYSNAATLFTLSDVGVSVHRYHDRIDVFTQSLENGAAQSGVEIALLNEKGQTVGQTKSDSDGHATLEKLNKGTLLLARNGEQTTLLDLSRPALDLAEFDIAGEQGYSKQFFMFGPRDLYRPGESVIVNALLRDGDGKPLPPQPVKLEVVKPDGQVTRTEVWQSANGLYQFTWPLSESAATGNWQMRVNTGDNQPRIWTFKVEDFMPERMALNLTAQSAPIAPEDTVNFDVTGRYLYGAPAAGNSLQGQLFLRPLRDAVAKLPGFQFGDINEQNLSRSLDAVELTLDEQGHTTVSAESQWGDVHSPLRLILQASLLESGGRPVTRRVEQAIWPAQAMPGIRPQFASKEVYDYRTDTTRTQPIVDEDSSAGFDIVYADAQGEKLAVSDLDVRLIRERRDYYWSWEESEGWRSQYDQKDLVEAEQKLTLAAGETGKVAFPVEWGSYRLEVRDPESNLVSSLRFWAGYSWQDNSDGTGAVRPDRVTLKIDKPSYKAGDTINLHIAAPAAGKGYALVESSDGPLWWKEIDVPAGGMDLAIPVDKSWQRHDLYLSTVVIRPGDKARSATPKRAVGILHLPLGDESRRLDLTLQNPAKMRPNQNLTVKVKASVKNGEVPKQINVLLSAVDSGVLNITDYKTPDPWDAFFGRKRYGADIYDIYGQVIEGEGRLAALRFGGDGDEGDELSRGGKKPVNHVTIIAQQAQPVALDENGEGTVTLPIGDFNGELRVMAQAWTDDRFGNSEEKVTVAAPLVSELAAPRFMTSGDTSRLALDLTNLTDRPQQLSVVLSAQGLLALNGASTMDVKLAPGARGTLFIPVRALEGFGDGEIKAVINGLALPGETLADPIKQWKIGVRPAFPAQTVNSGAVVKPGETWTLPPKHLSGIAESTLEGQLLLSGRPPLNLARYIRELKAYPYGCLEQTTSGLFPSLYTNEAELNALGIKGITDQQRRTAIDVGIARLLEMQSDNGAFGLWDKAGPEEYWLTAYVTDFLVRAGEQGYSVNGDALNKANQRLLRYLQDPGLIALRYSDDAPASRFAVQAYAGLVLARQQKAPLGALRELWQRHDQARAGLPLVQLGIALKFMGDEPRSQQAIALGLKTQRSDKQIWMADYGSELRDKAMMLSLLEENKLLPDTQNQLLLELSDMAWSQRWLSTQETNALFIAGHGLQNVKGDWQAQTSLGAQPLASSQSVTRNLSAQQLSDLQVTNTGMSSLYLRLDSAGYPQQAPAAYSNVLHIERHFLDAKGNTRPLSSLKSGELVMVWLDVWADKNVPDALVVDLLPAGLELENQNLANSSASLSDSASEVQALLNQMQQQDIQHMEFRDDRFVAALPLNEGQHATLIYLARAVTPGSYTVPVPQVESMYVPQWRGTGSSTGTLTVVP
ncbi:alpha-2-macroglobulin family protein [Enterobacter sp. Ap-1006]|uniref:alpha-2-macroglobulin family protein n=1 Tax=Enterobacter sp. Ap-1006 TaxID=2608345 RepID=UPI00141F4C18|nr:alpha-2-macroglobulin [Enterobacter sp. Ap-1006]NIF46240.1 alpha-2-macroglobulin family protein [Enterobacter sp. Ap-1006]